MSALIILFLRDDDPVVSAIRRGDVKAVRDLAASAPHSLMRENKDGWTPLHNAAYCGEPDCMKTLLNGLVDKRTLQEQTALLFAVSCEHLSCARCLLEAGADPDISSKNKETPLYKACELENVDMVSLVLSYGATVNQRCGQGWTALHEAVSKNNTEICEMLLRAGATINPPNIYSITPLTVAAQRGQLKVLCYLIGKATNCGLLPLHIAAQNGHHDVISLNHKCICVYLLSILCHFHPHTVYRIVSLLVPVTSRARLRHSWISPLHLAAEHNRHTVAAVLLKTGADVNATLSHSHSIQYADRRTTALFFAVASGGTKTAEVLLKAGASLSLDPVDPLLMAVRQGSVSTVSLLMENGADINANIPSYPTTFPGVIALCMNNIPLLKCLLDNGCNPLACFTCAYGSALHPPSPRVTQFCEWLSTSAVCNWAGPIIDLLLEHVGHVQLCARLTELLDSQDEWLAVKRKSMSPRPLLHLCRLRIRTQLGRNRLKSLTSLPLPDRLIRYLSLTTAAHTHTVVRGQVQF
uniref:Ankyrin repeat and SOCS box containing 2b n=1 Tax=Myripristis murdjan TaxID=586833 RepID=A0A667WHB2_9TELE